MSTVTRSVAAVGQGFVCGSLTTALSERGVDVYTYDKAGKQAPGGKHPINNVRVTSGGTFYNAVPANSIREFVEACEKKPGFTKIFFVAVPTPMYEDGECDTSIVEGVLRELAEVDGERIAVIKSTVPPGSTQKWNEKFGPMGLHVLHNPEFLTEANALNDCRNQDRIILGGPRPWINEVKQVYQAAWPNVPVIKTSSTNSELTKYVTNVFLATKVSLANELYQLCEALFKSGLDVDYDRVVECATLDKRLGTSHWKVPGPVPADDNGAPAYGFGSHCLPKDLNALMFVARQLGVDPKVMSGTWEKNLEVRPQRDWEKLNGRAVSKRK